ncbi:uncharacterized protein DUF1382 [Modicisalibacter xianhensis]|uniref:Uncharacterized protein DUF1382 n=1 Tax=Modicisalibacter xianhensis TaxID=442341 RepID=A0A4R8FVF2_9GAMM|nr:DUF1382 family protein [Halomonas xianhensis]TDX30798.1 uncharacterized protein DUF1382 [Halomonas xianhensis]
MDRASPAEARKALEAAHTYAKAGIPFVPMPILNAKQRAQTTQELARRIEQLRLEMEASDE